MSLPDLEPAILLDPEPRSFRIAAWVILAACAVVFAIQLRSLYVLPIPDSVAWGGDETWLMREFGNQASHGVMSYPESFDGSIRTDGLLAGSMWVEAVIYGATGNYFSPAHSLVDVGRTVTAILSGLLLIAIYLVSRRLGVSRLLSALAVLLVCSTKTFLVGTHSARYDILTGLALLVLTAFLTAHGSRRRTARGLLIAGFIVTSSIIFSRHLSTLALGIAILWIIRQRVWDDISRVASFVGGVILSLAALAAAYVAASGEFTLFGSGGGFGSYDFVLKQLPILRPFSRNVQVSNLLERYNLFGHDASGFLLMLLSAMMLVAGYLSWKLLLRAIGRSVKVTTTPSQTFFVSAAGLALVSWLLLQGARPYYAMHIVPVFAVAAMIVFEWLHETFEIAPLLRYPVPALAFVVALVQLPTSLPNALVGEAIVHDQQIATRALLNETPKHARVLCDVAGLNWALQDTQRHILTLDMFQPPADAGALAAKLKRNAIDYLLLRSSPVGSAFEPGRAYLPLYLRRQAVTQDSVLGFFYDDGRDYDGSIDTMITQGLDTLRLYRLSSARP